MSFMKPMMVQQLLSREQIISVDVKFYDNIAIEGALTLQLDL